MTGSTAAAVNRALGAYGESLAARHLVEQGMVLLDRNWRCEAGEIDLVLRDGRVLVVCEVKTRSSVARGHPHEAVDLGEGGPAGRARRSVAAGARRARRGDSASIWSCVIRPRRGPSTVDHVRGVL